jgi:hypothetical protein
MMEESKELTVGEKMVGLKFNLSGNQEVYKLKKMYAAIIDKLYSFEMPLDGMNGYVLNIIDTAVTNLITSQMWAVKALTFCE